MEGKSRAASIRCRRTCAGNSPAAAKPGSGIIVEDKGYSLALHYRNVPQDEDRLRASIDAGRAAFPGEATEVQSGKFMFEVKRPGVSKGEAVRALMAQAPFAGRQPVFIGDDVTDESVFALLPDMKGLGFLRRPAFQGSSRHIRLAEPGSQRPATPGGAEAK